MTPDIDREIAGLQTLDAATLRERWEIAFGQPAPARIGRTLMRRALTYDLQEKRCGGLRSATRRRLQRASADVAAGWDPAKGARPVGIGTRLLREWHGVVHEVTILDQGVRYRGETWPSLSAVAREITGTRWSGPRFFGLGQRR